VHIEFTCEGCGVDVLGIGYREVPRHRLCCLCEWVCEFVPPEEIGAVQHLLSGRKGQRWCFDRGSTVIGAAS
jgi:hypothetical protein